jgi:hypothetical protein
VLVKQATESAILTVREVVEEQIDHATTTRVTLASGNVRLLAEAFTGIILSKEQRAKYTMIVGCC